MNQIPQEERLAPLCTSILMSNNRDSAEAGLNTLHLILEGAGHNLSGEAWITIFEAVSALSGCTTNGVGVGVEGWIDRSDLEWGTCCTLAFQCLKLIVDDFLDELPEPQDVSLKTTRTALLDCCASFGSSKHDVNISLTATGMLWTVADQDPLPSTVDYVLSRLASLSSDDRPEVRNCSVNTLFSCVVGLGPSFSPDQWRICLSQTIFGVLDQITSRGLGVNVGTGISMGDVSENDSQISSSSRAEKTTTSESSNIPSPPSTTTTSNNNTTERYKVSVHHSRDSTCKQWATTQVLTLRGIERVLRQYFGKLLQTILVDAKLDCGNDGVGDDDIATQGDQHDDNEQQLQQQWFELAWSRILELALQCSTQVGGRETLDVRLAGVDMLVLCAQVSSKSGILAVTNPQRVSTNMQVVDGALRSVRPASSSLNVESSSSLQRDGIQQDEMHVQQNDKSSSLLSPNSTKKPGCDDEISGVKNQKYGLFKEVFRAFGKLRVHLNDNIDEEDTNASIYMETTSVQVMTKFCQGLSKLYECCKDNELFSSMDLTLEENSTEQSFVELVGILITKATGPPGSKYLSQAQRLCLELLQSMALSSSSLALELLVQIGGQAFLWQADDVVSNNNTRTFTGCEPLNNQAATIVSDTCLDKNVAWISKLRVVCKITELFSTHYTATEGTTKDTTACYKLLVPVMRGGLEALLPLKKVEQTLSSSYLFLEKVTEKVLTFLSLLLTSEGLRGPHYLANTEEILQILTSCSINMPRSKDAAFGDVLLTAVKQSTTIIKLLPIASDSKSSQTLENCLQIFKQCFKGTSRLICGTESLHSIIAPLFKDAIHIIDESERTEEILVPFDINIKLATTLCESLYQVTFVTDIAAELFPYLCKLMNSAEPNLRRGASNLLTRIDFGGVLERTKKAELKANNVAQLSRELIHMSNQMLSERDRAVAAEAQVEELEKRYESLFENFECLKSQKDRLEQQVAVLSEGSAYT